MEIDIEMLYGQDYECKLCGFERDKGHKSYCPGAVIDGLTYEVKYSTDESDGAVTGATLDECVEKAAEMLLSDGAHSCEARYVFEFETHDLDKRVQEARSRQVEKWRADMAEERRLAAERVRANDRAAKLAALEVLRPDLLPDAYERRKLAIESA